MLTAQSSIILIVDNQPMNLKMLFSFLQECGYKILVAKRGESAIKKLQKVSPDLILLDVMLPGLNGFETCERLKAAPETKDIPIIFMTALSESVDKTQGLKVGAVDYITKPFQQEEVLARIENQLKIKRLQKQLEEQNQRLQQEISTRRKIEERLELVIQAANDGFWDWNLESGEIYISPRCKEMLGYSDEELPNELASWENHVFPEDRIAVLKLVEDYNSDKVSHFEFIQRFHHKNGSTVHILVRALHLKDATGQIIRLLGAYTDITQITTTLEALRQSRRLLAGVLNSSLDGVAAFSALRDSEGKIIDFIWLLLNPVAEKITGRTESELVGKQMLIEMPGLFETGVFEQYVSVVETGEALETEHYYVYENIQAWFQVAAVKLGDGFTMTFRDITERKQMEERNQALLDAIPDIMFRQRVDGTYVDVRAKEGSSIVPANLISRNLRDISLVELEAVKPRIFEHLQSAIETGKLQIYEYEIPRSDGVHTYESRCVRSGADEAIRIVRDVTERKRAEAALRESEAQFRGIFENAAIGIGLTGVDGTLLKANPTLEAFLGYSEAEMRGKDFANITYPDDRTIDLTLTSEVIDGVRDSFQIEKRYIRKDGQIFWGRLTVSAVRNLAGDFQFTVAILEDINDRKLRELALDESERRFRATFNASFQFTALLEPDGTVIEANQTVLDFGGVKLTDVAGLPFWNTFYWREEDGERGSWGRGGAGGAGGAGLSPKQEQLREAIQQAALGQFVRYEVDFRGAGDRVITIDFSIKPVLDETGEVVLLLPEGRDISDRKKAEERLRLLESAVVNANDAVLITEAEPINWPGPRIVYVNEAFTRMTGYSKEEVIGQTPRILQGPKTERAALSNIQQALRTWQSVRVELINYRKDGSQFWIELEIVPVADETGWFTHWVSVQRDITERKLVQEVLLIARKRLEYLLSSSPSIIYSCSTTEPYGATFVSENVTAIMGYEPQQFIEDASFWISRIHPDDIDRVLTQLPQIFEVGHHSYEYRFLHQDGTYRWVLDAIKIVRDNEGNFVKCIGSWLDITERKQAEERLRLLERAIAASGNAIVIGDAQAPDNPIIYVNSGFERMTGYQREDVIGNRYGSYLQIGATPTVFEEVQSAIAQGRATQVTLCSSRIDGTLFWNELCITPVRDAIGRLTHFIGVQTDISDRKQVEEALRISEERLQLAIEGSGMGLWDWQLNTGQAYFDPQWKTMLGYEVEDIENSFLSWERLLHPEDLPFAIEALTAHFEGQTSIYEMEVRMLSKSGEWKWILSQGKVMERDVSGVPVRMTGTHIDISDRILAQESLRESEERFRTMADSTAVLLWMADTEGLSTFFNKTWLAFTGRTLEDELGLGWLDNVHPDDRQRCLETCFKAIEVRENFEVEYRLLRFDGEYRWIVDLGKPRFTPNGNFSGYIGSCLDITERKQAEIEIKTAKTDLERQIQRVLLLERITQEIRSSWNPQQIFQTAASQVGEAFRVNRCIIHTYIANPVPRIPQVAEYTEPGYPSMMDIEIPVVGNSHAELVLSQDKAVASNDVYSDPLLEGISEVMQHLGLKSVLVVRTSYQDKPNGIICLEQCDRFRVWTAEEIELLEAVAAQMGIAIAQANLLEQETQQRQELAAQNHALEKAKLEAEAANLAKSQFLSKMSHELRTPLNAILGFSQVMARHDSLSSEQLEHLRIINRSGEHLLELINDILSMSKIEAGQITLNENRFDLYHLLDSLEEMLQLKAASKGLELIVERTPDLPQYVQTDEGKLRQILINLLGNAIKFTQTGSVTLRLRGGSREENCSTPYSVSSLKLQPTLYSLTFEIEDTGPGIAPEELDAIFDPFVQTRTGRESMEGTGLGLPISQQFVRMLGGDITVNSTFGQGAIFAFEIQVSLATSADEKPLLSQRQVISLEPNQPSYRILVVEDVVENRQLLVEILRFVGFEVREATNGQEGVALWESWSPHVICMDIIMPIMDGYDATAQIKRSPKGKDTVIIALTASAFEEQQEAILRAGCDDFLPKPFQQEVLLDKIAHHLGVSYVYGEQRSPTLDQPRTLEEHLTPKTLAVMPTSWVTQLHEAALYADDELMNQLVEQIPLEYGSLYRALKDMLNNFRLEELIDLTESARSLEG